MRGPLTYGTVIALLLIVPILVLDGEPGAFMPPLVLSYAGAVIAAFVVALTVTPALSRIVIGNSGAARTSPVVGWLQPRYDRGVATLVRSVAPGIVVGVVLLVVGLVVLPFLDRGDSIVPEFEDRSLLVQWEGAPGMSLPEMQRIVARAGTEIDELDGIDSVGGHVGRAILGDQTVGVNSGELWVTVDPSANYGDTVSSIEEVATGYPGVHGTVLTYPRERVNDVLDNPNGVRGKDLTVRVFGANQDVLNETTDDVRAAIDDVDGVEGVVIDSPIVEPTLDVEVDLDRAQAFGIKPGDVRRTAATMFNGITVGNLFEEQKIFEVTVEGADDLRGSVDDLRNLQIDLPSGGQVTLSEVADVNVVASPNVIKHEDISRYVDIGLDVGGRDLDAVAGDLQAAIADVDFPIEYHAEVLEDFENRQSDRVLFIGLAIAALIGIFLLLQAAFSSWTLAAVLFVALPGALTGGLIAVLIDADDVTIGSLAGLLAVYALAARAAVLFVKRCQAIEDHRSAVFGAQPSSASLDDEGEVFGPELVRSVAAERFGPTIATAGALILVFLPLTFAGGAGLEVIGPMAAVVLGGVITTALLTLFVVPSLYLWFGKRAEGTRDQFDTFLEAPGEGGTPQAPSLIDA